MNIQRFLKQIHLTQDQEILCSDCLDQVNQYVDLELNGQPAEVLMPDLKRHLDICTVCHEEYVILRDLSQAQQDEQPPSTDELLRFFRE
jgi:hypothetical protein